MNRITADSYTLLQQASMTAHDYMLKAVEDIDKIFGDGYASRNPSLVGDYMKTASIDFATSSLSVAIQNHEEGLKNTIDILGRNL